MKRLVAVAAFLLRAMPSRARDVPPAHYENWGVCPFACCAYREWIADDDVAVRQERSEQSSIVFRLHRGEAVDAVTGVVVTETAAPLMLGQAVRDGYVKGSDQPQPNLQNGNIIYILSWLGEGSWLFWYQGKVYRSGDALAPAIAARSAPLRASWRKLVKNRAGTAGWTMSDQFRNADACG